MNGYEQVFTYDEQVLTNMNDDPSDLSTSNSPPSSPIVDESWQDILEADIEEVEEMAEAVEEARMDLKIEAISIIQDLEEHFKFKTSENEYVQEKLINNQKYRENPHYLVLGASLASAGVGSIKDGTWRAYRMGDEVVIEQKENGSFSKVGTIEWKFARYLAVPFARSTEKDIREDHADLKSDNEKRHEALTRDGKYYGTGDVTIWDTTGPGDVTFTNGSSIERRTVDFKPTNEKYTFSTTVDGEVKLEIDDGNRYL